MRTAIVSDLHLGSAFGEDLLRDAGIRRALLEEIAGAERLVLLGDAFELRELPLPAVLRRVRPFVQELGEAMAGREVVLVPGNHDHRLAEPLLEVQALAGRPLGLEQRAEPRGEAADRLTAWLGRAELSIAYPGLRLRSDVYATHGHYMDCHMTLPRLECLAAATSMRALGPLPERAAPDDYERVLRPIYGLGYSLAQTGMARRATRPSERAWRTVASGNSGRGRLGDAAVRAAIAAGIPASVWSINRVLRAGFDPDLSSAAITRSGIAAATELSQRLGIEAAHLIVGHTHRGGPGEGEDEWPLPGGGRLHNTGSWVFASAFHRPGTPPSPYWPGTVTWIDDEGPPRRVRLLLERSRDELRALTRRLASDPA
ncbi:MAG TPA: metallophosphoesterase [Solirubrobacterales bacterium]